MVNPKPDGLQNLLVRRYGRLALLALLVCAIGACSHAESVTEWVAMSDGVRLPTVVHLPAGDGPWPVVLERTPYDRTQSAANSVFRLHEHGYAVVVQQLRGTRDAEGEWTVFGSDGWGGPGFRDGADCVAWVREQPWCDGKVGVMGFSASGIAASLLVAAAPEGLACAYIVGASDHLYESFFHGTGCWRTNTAQWPEARGYLDEMAAHPAYDAFWVARNARSRCGQSPVPVYAAGGWFDLFQRSTVSFFQGQHTNGLPGSDGHCKLVLHPVPHAAVPEAMGIAFPDRGPPNADALVGSPMEWLAYWLKGEDNGILDKPAAALFVMTDPAASQLPGNVYRTFDTWPPPYTPQRFYLAPEGGLTKEAPSGSEGSAAYTYDPASPVPSIGGNNLYPPSGPHDQRPIESRSDVVVFETEPLDSPITLMGPVRLTLYASSDAPDTDFGAILCDVYPDGRSMKMLDGMVRARYRLGPDQEAPVEPDEVYAFEIDLWDTALIVAPGHRLRLIISSSNSPRFAPNPNTGAPFALEPEATRVAHNRIYFNADHPSHLTLSVAE